MSRSRQSNPGPSLRAVAVGFSSGYRWRGGLDAWGQLVRASPGIIRVRLGAAFVVVAPTQGLWIPPGVPHEVHMTGRGVLQRVYLRRTPRTPAHARVVPVSPLLRELLRRVHRHGTLDRAVPSERHLMDLLLDEFAASAVEPLSLPVPSEPRALRAAAWVRDHPCEVCTPAFLAKHAGASARTLERLFKTGVGMSLGAWRQRARMMHALTLLAEGTSVTATALALGYASTSAFVAAFRRVTGSTPGRYFRDASAPRPSPP